MKKFVLILGMICMLISVTANAQKLIIGEKAPDVRVKQWIGEKPDDNKARLIEFFYSSNKQSAARLVILEDYARKYNGLHVIIISKEPVENLTSLTPAYPSIYIATDDAGKTHSNYTIQFVPYTVLIDSKGRVVWFGNPSSLDESKISAIAQ